ncbi:hypothetical protein DBR06_SOUSAS43410004, partial [Sousa chinensis]
IHNYLQAQKYNNSAWQVIHVEIQRHSLF